MGGNPKVTKIEAQSTLGDNPKITYRQGKCIGRQPKGHAQMISENNGRLSKYHTYTRPQKNERLFTHRCIYIIKVNSERQWVCVT